jgi:endonuclease/exonuclease/phosphatase family metal-dependent hydrolase
VTEHPLIGFRSAPDLHVLTINVRRNVAHGNPRSPDLWSYRRNALRRMLERERPAILGTQEALFPQAVWVSESLGPHHRRLGHGRDADGRGEGCPLFIDTRRLLVESWSQFALSDTPNVPGSRSWGNLVPRIAVTAELLDRATGERFRVINTHLDHLSRRARSRSADMLAELVAADPLPTLVMGDFNTSVGTEPYRRILGRGMRDSWNVAQRRLTDAWGTFPNYRAPRRDTKRIDWILASDGVEVREAAIDPSRIGGIAPTDHLPVHAVVRVAGAGRDRGGVAGGECVAVDAAALVGNAS